MAADPEADVEGVDEHEPDKVLCSAFEDLRASAEGRLVDDMDVEGDGNDGGDEEDGTVAVLQKWALHALNVLGRVCRGFCSTSR